MWYVGYEIHVMAFKKSMKYCIWSIWDREWEAYNFCEVYDIEHGV